MEESPLHQLQREQAGGHSGEGVDVGEGGVGGLEWWVLGGGWEGEGDVDLEWPRLVAHYTTSVGGQRGTRGPPDTHSRYPPSSQDSRGWAACHQRPT